MTKKTTQVAIRFPADMVEEMRARAAARRISVAELVRRLCRHGLEGGPDGSL